ncbi:hypothetical protein BKA67DRAFT_312224 [Truncatella angustata]|uniref:Secreted protein n=1 Tax=Truncatella angustata TaxID=152316 RepID=A0A9P8ZXP9_9PEZI|nr:uncharacterized protein BKA67DRAFT_312224 [Truncatella angustata]KAH6653238.1 hypothetical protein BKA67DRAFT_312224 [Truncatella angustata]
MLLYFYLGWLFCTNYALCTMPQPSSRLSSASICRIPVEMKSSISPAVECVDRAWIKVSPISLPEYPLVWALSQICPSPKRPFQTQPIPTSRHSGVNDPIRGKLEQISFSCPRQI